MIYDYGGFPEHTYSVTYPAPGDADLARRVIDLASGAGIDTAGDDTRGFDHGVFVPLFVAFPQADIPVVAVSLRAGLDPAEHLAFGRALAPLRGDDVLIIGSGLSPHDLRFRVTPEETESFHTWLDETLALGVADRDARLAAWQSAPAARACHPREEHLLPLMVAAGAGDGDTVRRICDVDMFGLPATGYRFGDE
jgi:aromatic ring-opening dioxygenase catalytic subunit (LigB family)